MPEMEKEIEAYWFDYHTPEGEARLRIRVPLPPDAPPPLPEGETAPKRQEEAYRAFFCHVLVEWEGVLDGDGKPLKLSDQIKGVLCRHHHPSVLFVVDTAIELLRAAVASEDALRSWARAKEARSS